MTPSHAPAGPDLVDVALTCRCGAVRGVVHAIPRGRTNRAVCLCDDCQAYAHFLGRATEVLDANGGTDIVPVAPRHLELSQGREHVRCVRLTPDGMYRWYAGCCNTPIVNTPALRRLPFAGMVHTIVDPQGGALLRDEVFGPIQTRMQAKFGIPPLPADAHPRAPLTFLLRVARFLLGGALRGDHRPSPFFDPTTGRPIVEPRVLAPDEREALRPRCGPHPTSR